MRDDVRECVAEGDSVRVARVDAADLVTVAVAAAFREPLRVGDAVVVEERDPAAVPAGALDAEPVSVTAVVPVAETEADAEAELEGEAEADIFAVTDGDGVAVAGNVDAAEAVGVASGLPLARTAYVYVGCGV